MKNWKAWVAMMSIFSLIFSGCDPPAPGKIVDGPGMVNYDGLMMDALTGGWLTEDERFRADFKDDYRVTISRDGAHVLVGAALTPHADSADTEAYC